MYQTPIASQLWGLSLGPLSQQTFLTNPRFNPSTLQCGDEQSAARLFDQLLTSLAGGAAALCIKPATALGDPALGAMRAASGRDLMIYVKVCRGEAAGCMRSWEVGQLESLQLPTHSTGSLHCLLALWPLLHGVSCSCLPTNHPTPAPPFHPSAGGAGVGRGHPRRPAGLGQRRCAHAAAAAHRLCGGALCHHRAGAGALFFDIIAPGIIMSVRIDAAIVLCAVNTHGLPAGHAALPSI